jgi:hypothetical protein
MSTDNEVNAEFLDLTESDDGDSDEADGGALQPHENSDETPQLGNERNSNELALHKAQAEQDFNSTRPSGILNQFCETCQKIFRKAEEILQHKINDIRGDFIPFSSWAWNGHLAGNCHLCALLLHNKGYDLPNFIEYLNASRDYRKTISFTLECEPQSNTTLEQPNEVRLSITSEGFKYLSSAVIRLQSSKQRIDILQFFQIGLTCSLC